jgi:GH15 family glucan-1,4-alpha-glucosidase
MPRDLPLSNGSLLVNFDLTYQHRDTYFPHVGQENHTVGGVNRVGVWVDGAFTWLNEWPLDLRYQAGTLVTEVTGRHAALRLRLRVHDAVDCQGNILVRRFTFADESGAARTLRLFAHFDAYIGGSGPGNTAYFDGEYHALVCYKGDRYFLLASEPACSGYAAGLKGLEGLQGTWRDAEDGALSYSAVAIGLVDATLQCEIGVPPHGEATAYIWLAAGHTLPEVADLHALAMAGPGRLIDRTAAYWRFWLTTARREFADLSQAAIDLYHRSLLLARTQIGNNGAITAANDSGVAPGGMDHYSYVWPRDAALVAEALDLAGYHEVPREFYRFLRRMLDQTGHAFPGYLLQRYTPTGFVASSWHPHVTNGRKSLPIQEDETALVLYGLHRHLALTGDVELLRDLYPSFVRPAADFMLAYRDERTGLPRPSYDLWEEKHGITLFTTSTVFAALRAAADFAAAMGDGAAAASYRQAAAEIQAAAARYFYDSSTDRFVFMLHVDEQGNAHPDYLLDASMAGAFLFGLFPADDPRMASTMHAIQQGLGNAPPVGGIARHGADYYCHLDGNYARYQGNTWFVSTLWLADWLTMIGRRAEARDWLEWCAARALPSGVLSEQLHPLSGAPLSVAPLTWSHAAYIASVERYLRAAGEG